MNKLWFCFLRRNVVSWKGQNPEPYSIQNFKIASRHYKKIKNYCKSNDIQLTLSLFGTNSAGTVNGLYDISINNQQTPFEVLATALHELGHIIRWENLKQAGQGDTIEKLFLVQSALYMGMISSNGAELLYSEEENAWQLGEQFAKENGIELGSWFYDVKVKSLLSYVRLKDAVKYRK